MECRPIKGYEERYFATAGGDIISVRRFEDGSSGKPMKPALNRHGYLDVNLSKEGKHRTFRVHKLVAEAFHGPRPLGKIVHHKDGNKLNNRADNLEWLSHHEHGLHHAVSKLETLLEKAPEWMDELVEYAYERLVTLKRKEED